MPFQFCYSSYSAKSPVVDILKENGERMRYFINDLINKDTLEIIIKENFTANFQAFTRDYRFRLHVNIATDTKNLFNLQLLDMESFNFNSYNY